MSVSVERVDRRSPVAELSPVSWVPGGELGYEEWLHQGSRLGLAGRNAAWWIGDWVRYGTARYGGKYTAGARVTGYDRQTLMNMVYVASKFEISRRRKNLSWSHHAEVAALDLEEQERWLNHAVVEKLSVRDLRDELASVRQAASRSAGPLAVASPAAASSDEPAVSAQNRVSSDRHEAPPPSPEAPSEHVVVCPHCGQSFVP